MLQPTKQPSNALNDPEVDREDMEKLEKQLRDGFETARNEYEEKAKKRKQSLRRNEKDCDEDNAVEEDGEDVERASEKNIEPMAIYHNRTSGSKRQ